jgi:hypothetical protein
MQADTSLERSTSGLGIGLTLVRNLVELHSGSVEVHSAGIGQGSTFTVRLPLVAHAPDQMATGPTAAPAATFQHRRILVVDDNHDATDSIALLLRHMGHEVHTAYDGEEGVEATGTYKPDIVLMDIGLPRLNGYEAARRIRMQPWGRNMFPGRGYRLGPG